MQQRPWVRRKANENRLWAWMPYEGGSNRAWILGELGTRIRPEWNKPERRWEIARRHLWVLTDAMAERFGEVDLYLEFSATDICDARCKNADPASVHDCVCSCLGEFHGGRGDRREWKLSGATTLISEGPIRERYKLISKAEPPRLPQMSDQRDEQDKPAPTPTQAVTDHPEQPSAQRVFSVETAARSNSEAPSTDDLPGCGTAIFLTTVVIFGILALTVNGLFWIGVAVAVLAVMAVGAERFGLL